MSTASTQRTAPAGTASPPKIGADVGRSYQSFDEVQLANVPKELQGGKRFVCWREEIRNGKPTKVPVNPHTGNDAKSDDAATWSTFHEAIAFFKTHRNKLQGVGRMFDPVDGIVGVDFDNCLNDHGEIIPGHAAEKWLPRIDSYSEVSPSGRGVKVWVHASLDLEGKTGRRDAKQGVEIYRERRYFTLTGQRLTQFSCKVEARQSEVAEFYRAIFGARKPASTKPVTPTSTTLTDAEIISRASNAKNGTEFNRLWDGHKDGYGSQSEADAALCHQLWFWTGDREAVRRLFGQSGLGQRNKWRRRDYQEKTLAFACQGEVYSPERLNQSTLIHDEMRAVLDDQRPKARLHGDNWLLSQTAAELGQHLADKSLFIRNGVIVALDAGELRAVTAQTFRTLVEQHVVCYRQRKATAGTFDISVTMTDDEARGIMASPQFKEKLRQVDRLNSCRLPVFRADGKLELLPEGYDPASKTLTINTVNYPEDMPLAVAVETINDLLGEFCFADGERSKAVAVAALVGLYAAQLLPEGTLRPCIIATKNAEGAGATTLVSCAVVPVIGRLPTGNKSNDDDETRKFLTAAVREARLVILFDNQKARLSSTALETFLSSPTWDDRLLGANQTFSGRSIATVFVTANGCTVSPDMRRRSLFIELHLEAERAEDRQFRRPLDETTLLELRPKILAACWSLVRDWHKQGQPSPSRSHSAFPAWAKIIGGVVQAAGWACPLDTADVAVAADEEGEDMRRLVAGMKPGVPYTFAKMVELCQATECFDGLVGESGAELKNASRVKLGRLLGRYDRRLVKHYRFVVDGERHTRRFHVEEVESDARSHVQHAISVQAGESTYEKTDQGEHAERVERASQAVEPAITEPEVQTREDRTGTVQSG